MNIFSRIFYFYMENMFLFVNHALELKNYDKISFSSHTSEFDLTTEACIKLNTFQTFGRVISFEDLGGYAFKLGNIDKTIRLFIDGNNSFIQLDPILENNFAIMLQRRNLEFHKDMHNMD